MAGNADYEQARNFIKEASKSGIIYGLDSMRSLMAQLGNVQEQVSYVHVAGTNGKGSVCAMLAQILMACGYRTGIYASPAVFEPEEIIKINGEPVSKERFAALIAKIQNASEAMEKKGLRQPTAFEAETAAAFSCFKEENCEIVLLETGMGGSLDATNLITHPVLSILTAISIDHRAFLGDTLTEIAEAKTGILKPGCPCVTAPQKPEALAVIRKAAAEKGSELWTADSSFIRRFTYNGEGSEFETAAAQTGFPGRENAAADDLYGMHGRLALTGAFQKENLACVLAAVCVLRKKGYRISARDILKGLSEVQLAGRFERIRREPEFYIDGAHNEGAALCLRQTVQDSLADKRIVFIIGVLADKEYEKVLRIMLPLAAAVFTVTPLNPRALSGRELARQASAYHAYVSYVPQIPQAVRLAIEAAGTDGAVVAFGSFSYLKELKQAVKGE